MLSILADNKLADDKSGVFSHVISILENYIRRFVKDMLNTSLSPISALSSPVQPPLVELKNDIAMVAFQPYERRRRRKLTKSDKIKGNQLTSYSLAATILPLIKVGFDRLVIIGKDEDGYEYTRYACQVLESIINDYCKTEGLTIALNGNELI